MHTPHPSFFYVGSEGGIQGLNEHFAGSPASHFLSLKDGSNPVNLDPDSTMESVVAEPYKPVSHFFFPSEKS